jgi:hypothetical protein
VLADPSGKNLTTVVQRRSFEIALVLAGSVLWILMALAASR